MDIDTFFARARSMPGARTVYWAGAGGVDPAASSAAARLRVAQVWAGLDAAQRLEFGPVAAAAGIDVQDPDAVLPACDCSGYVCWALGLARRQPRATAWTTSDGWINTDSLWNDARAGQVGFRRLPADGVVVGALLVHPKPPDRRYGHVGIVTATTPGGRAARVLHCSADNFRRGGDAVAETDAEPFADPALRTLAVWPRRLGEPARPA